MSSSSNKSSSDKTKHISSNSGPGRLFYEKQIMSQWRKALGSVLALLRYRKGLTLKEVANMIGATDPLVSMLEKGKCSPSEESLNKLAEVYGTTADSIVRSVGCPRCATFIEHCVGSDISVGVIGAPKAPSRKTDEEDCAGFVTEHIVRRHSKG